MLLTHISGTLPDKPPARPIPETESYDTNVIDKMTAFDGDSNNDDQDQSKLNSTLDKNFEYRHGCIYETIRTSFFNPPTIASAIKVDFDFIASTVASLQSTYDILDATCEELSKNTHEYDTKHDFVWAMGNGRFTFKESQCHRPLPLYHDQRQVLANTLRRYGDRFAHANLKYHKGSILTLNNEKPPEIILQWMETCQYDKSLLNENTKFVFELIYTKNSSFTLTAPCPVTNENWDAEVNTYCTKQNSTFRHLQALCNEKLESILYFKDQLSQGLKQLKDEISEHLRPKRELISITLFAIAIFTSLISIISTTMSTNNHIVQEGLDSDINSLISTQNQQLDDITSLARYTFDMSADLEKINTLVQFTSKIHLLQDSAQREFDFTKDKLHKIFNIMDTCRSSSTISSMALTQDQKRFITDLANSKFAAVNLVDGKCHLEKGNGSLYLNFEFPLIDDTSKVKVIKTTCLPLYDSVGRTKQPNVYTKYAAVFHTDKNFAPLSEKEFLDCSKSTICNGEGMITKAEGICGIQNYLDDTNPCHYTLMDPQPISDFFSFPFDNNLLLHGPEGLEIERSCRSNDSPAPTSIIMKKGPTHLKVKNKCSYKTKKATFTAGARQIQLYLSQIERNHDKTFGTHENVNVDIQKVFPEISAEPVTASQTSKQQVSHVATTLVTSAVVTMLILFVLCCGLYTRKRYMNSNMHHYPTYESNNNTTFLQPRTIFEPVDQKRNESQSNDSDIEPPQPKPRTKFNSKLVTSTLKPSITENALHLYHENGIDGEFIDVSKV